MLLQARNSMPLDCDLVIQGLRERIISVVLKTYEVKQLLQSVRAHRFLPVGFHLGGIEASGAEQLMFACVLSLEAEQSNRHGSPDSFEVAVLGEIGFESPHWEIQQICDVSASPQQTLW
jgi:hypothetical protein